MRLVLSRREIQVVPKPRSDHPLQERDKESHPLLVALSEAEPHHRRVVLKCSKHRSPLGAVELELQELKLAKPDGDGTRPSPQESLPDPEESPIGDEQQANAERARVKSGRSAKHAFFRIELLGSERQCPPVRRLCIRKVCRRDAS
jgi:hypothetical protein